MNDLRSGVVARKCEGEAYFLAGTFAGYDMEKRLQNAIRNEGGKLAKVLSRSVNTVVLGTALGSRTRTVEQEAKKLGVRVVKQHDFQRELLPSREEALALLRGSKSDRERFRLLVSARIDGPDGDLDMKPYRIDLRKADLENCDFGYLDLNLTDLDGANLRGIRMRHHGLPPILRGACLDRAQVSVSETQLIRCQLRGAEVRVGPNPLENVDLSEARIIETYFSELRWRGCKAVRADFSERRMQFVRPQRWPSCWPDVAPNPSRTRNYHGIIRSHDS